MSNLKKPVWFHSDHLLQSQSSWSISTLRNGWKSSRPGTEFYKPITTRRYMDVNVLLILLVKKQKSISVYYILFSQAQLGRIQDTRTTLLRKSRPLPEAPSMWKLPRFQQVKAPIFFNHLLWLHILFNFNLIFNFYVQPNIIICFSFNGNPN